MEQHSKQNERDLSVLIAVLQCIFFIHRCRGSCVTDATERQLEQVPSKSLLSQSNLKGLTAFNFNLVPVSLHAFFPSWLFCWLVVFVF